MRAGERLVVKQIVFGVDMRNGEHVGLKRELGKLGIQTSKLETGELVFCINRAGNALKIVTANGVFYQKLPKKQNWDFGMPERWKQALDIASRSLNLRFSFSSSCLKKASASFKELHPKE